MAGRAMSYSDYYKRNSKTPGASVDNQDDDLKTKVNTGPLPTKRTSGNRPTTLPAQYQSGGLGAKGAGTLPAKSKVRSGSGTLPATRAGAPTATSPGFKGGFSRQNPNDEHPKRAAIRRRLKGSPGMK